MTPTIITLIVLAVVIIVASCFIGMGETKESENIEIKDIPEDKKQKIDAMVDDYFGKAVGKKSGNLKSMIDKEIAGKIKANSDKLDQENKKNIDQLSAKLIEIDKKVENDLGRIDAYSNRVYKEIDQRANSRIAEIDDESQVVLAKFESKQAELQKLQAEIEELKNQIAAGGFAAASKSAPAAEDAQIADAVEEKLPFANAAPASEEELFESVEDAEADEEFESAVQAAIKELDDEDAQNAQEEKQDRNSRKKNKRNKKNKKKAEKAAEAAEEPVDAESETEVLTSFEDTEELAEEANDDHKVISMADRLAGASSVEDEDIDEDSDEEQEDISDLEKTESLDEILAVEGISLEGGNTEENVMGMYHAGFSILEISKLLDLGVGEVKYVIDKHQGE